MIDPFAPLLSTSDELREDATKKCVTLFELNNMVRFHLQHSMPDCYWLKAEISELRVASNGHCYMELVQKDSLSNSIVARAKANIWRQNYNLLSEAFSRITGQMLTSGIKVLVCVTISFHELYGYSLNVIDIDPTYTLGDLEQQKKEIIKQLQDDGVIDLNKELPLPRIIEHIAVISSPTAAGYGDFCNQLQQSGYRFHVKLFAATMQGEQVESSIIEALNHIINDRTQWDVVVIIRGGGASTDLNGFNTYLLGANVAQYPLPILSGIGHERDDTIVDMVAHTRLKTPTAVAAFIIDSRSNEVNILQSLQQRLENAVTLRLQNDKAQIEAISQRLSFATKEQFNSQQQMFQQLSHRFERVASVYVSRQKESVIKLSSKLEIYINNRLITAHNSVNHYPKRLQLAAENLFFKHRKQHELLSKSIAFASPKRILSMGYSITLHNGKVVKDATQLQKGDTLTTQLLNGEIESTVN